MKKKENKTQNEPKPEYSVSWGLLIFILVIVLLMIACIIVICNIH